MDEILKGAREMLADVTPLRTDCGRACGGRCCRSLEGEETGMLLFPGEAEAYRKKPGWTLREAAAGTLLICPGTCDRQERPLACRLFPLLPVIRDGQIKVAVDQRAKGVCPLARHGLRGMNPAFVDAVREAGRLLAEKDEYRRFLEEMTKEHDELKKLRGILGGSL